MMNLEDKDLKEIRMEATTNNDNLNSLDWAKAGFSEHFDVGHCWDQDFKYSEVPSGKISNASQRGTKHLQLSETLDWVTQNYEVAEGVCLPRCVLYHHYLDFCKKKRFHPAGPATFGKMIRQRFPLVTTRRLGTRGQSMFSGIKIKTEGSSKKYSLNSKSGTLLPEFPKLEHLLLKDGIDNEKIKTFLVMYRTHCQRILDTVIGANFEEVQKFFIHFWHGMPTHLNTILTASVVCDLIAYCDSVLYKILNDVLIPSTIQEIPESLNCEIKSFIHHFPVWLKSSLEFIPPNVQHTKMQVMRRFVKGVERQLSFIQLAQTVRSVLNNQEVTSHMYKELRYLDSQTICGQLCYIAPMKLDKCHHIFKQFFPVFMNLLNKQSPLEDYMEWLDDVIDTCVIQPIQTSKRRSAISLDFMLRWSYLTFLFMRDLTLRSSTSFGSFHLLGMLFDEYIQLVLDGMASKEQDSALEQKMKMHLKTSAAVLSSSNKELETNFIEGASSEDQRTLFGSDVDHSSTAHNIRLEGISNALYTSNCFGNEDIHENLKSNCFVPSSAISSLQFNQRHKENVCDDLLSGSSYHSLPAGSNVLVKSPAASGSDSVPFAEDKNTSPWMSRFYHRNNGMEPSTHF